MYVHDDAFGPYCYIEPIDNFSKWQCRWEEYTDCVFFVTRLLIPIYPKIRLNFSFIYAEYQHRRNELEAEIQLKHQSKRTSIEFLLYDINKYKEFILNKNIEFLTERKNRNQIEIVRHQKTDFLIESLPRFIWIIRYNKDGKPKHDRVYDGTDTLPNLIGHIEFLNVS